jgi:adenine-specific DNA-methyltransferase
LPPSNLWSVTDETGSNRKAKNELKSLFSLSARDAFDTPKPERLLERIIHIATDPGDLVLDCFAGSGTTAAVAHKMGRRWVTCELLPDNVERFTLPRLRKVVGGDDTGGISTNKRRAPAVGLEIPGGVTPDEAQTFQSLLRRIADGLDGLDQTTLSALRKATRTREIVDTHWTGGGGFSVATLAPSMYEVIDGEPYLSAEATNGAFARHIAGQLGFRYEDAAPFCGRRGRRRLAVIDGFVSGIDVTTILSNAGESESVRIIAKGFDEDAKRALSTASRGSTIERAPDYLRASGGLS